MKRIHNENCFSLELPPESRAHQPIRALAESAVRKGYSELPRDGAPASPFHLSVKRAFEYVAPTPRFEMSVAVWGANMLVQHNHTDNVP